VLFRGVIDLLVGISVYMVLVIEKQAERTTRNGNARFWSGYTSRFGHTDSLAGVKFSPSLKRAQKWHPIPAQFAMCIYTSSPNC
jgi:hypothetical protein